VQAVEAFLGAGCWRMAVRVCTAKIEPQDERDDP
jgi:hypothetical protein